MAHFLLMLTFFSFQDHNKRCLDVLEPYLQGDKRALKWLRRETDLKIGLANAGPGGIYINWD